MKRNAFILITLILCLLSCGVQHADLIINNAKIITFDNNVPEAEALAVSGGRIIAVGSTLAMDKYRTHDTRVIDAEGHLVLPGFIDAHCHFASGGRTLRILNFRGIGSKEKIRQMVAEKIAALPPGSLVYGTNYDHSLFPDGDFPNKGDLDPVSPDNPVVIRRADGHSIWVNSAALSMSGIDKNTGPPFGGAIIKDPDTGEPTGILKESAMDLIRFKDLGYAESDNAYEDIKLALKHAAELGLTGIHTSAGLNEYKIFKRLKEEGALTLRVYAWQYLDQLDTLLSLNMRPGDGDDMLRVGFLKSFIDGSLGSGSALFFEPFTDDPSTSGLAQYEEDVFNGLIARAHREGYQTGTHAIGTRGVHIVLNAIAQAIDTYGQKDVRHRIEHAQHMIDSDFPRFAALDVVASMQPSHCSTDMRFCEKRIGKERCKGSYAWKSMLDNDVMMAFGSDWPVEPLNPMRNIYTAVVRKNIESGLPEGGWFPEQRLTMHDAIKYFTIGSAFASFEEDEKGSLTPGKLADIVVLDQDLFTIPEDKIMSTKVLYTILGGEIVYQRQ